MIRRSWQLLMDWLFATQPLFPPSTDASRDRSLAGKARVKARRAAARQLRQLL